LKSSRCNVQQIILQEQHLPCRNWWMRILSAAIVSLLCVVLLNHQTQAQMAYDMDPLMQDRFSGYRTREQIFETFRQKKISRLQGLEIAEAIIEQSRRTDIPVKTFLGLMRTESNFTVRAVSSSRAMGLMQIHPVTWKRYTKKLSLSSSREEAFRPSVNIMVSAVILRDLYDKYQAMGYEEPELWDHIFSAYYSGEGSVRGGLNRRHRHYVTKVRTHIGEYSQRLDG
jgi:soluble lytic murein transglycosylase-like protein